MSRSAGRLASLARRCWTRYASSEIRPSRGAKESGGAGGERGMMTWTVPLAGAGLLAYWWGTSTTGTTTTRSSTSVVTLVDDRVADDRGLGAEIVDAGTVSETDTTEAGTIEAETVSDAVTVLDSRIINELLAGESPASDNHPKDTRQADIAGESPASDNHPKDTHQADIAGESPASDNHPKDTHQADIAGESPASDNHPKDTRQADIAGESPASDNHPKDTHQADIAGESPASDNHPKDTHQADIAGESPASDNHPKDTHQADKRHHTSPSRLIALSNERPFFLSAEDLDFTSRLKQAEADAHVIELVRRSLEARHEGLVSMTSRLKETLGSLEAMQQELLLAQSKAQEIRHERSITRERIKRQEVLDSVRIQCDALTAALGAASERYARARELTRLSLSLRRIKDGLLDGGHETKRWSLKEILERDLPDTGHEKISPLLDSLRRNLEGEKRLKPLAALRAQFEKDVKTPATELAYIPEGRGSMVTALLSKVAAGLRVDGGDDEWDAIRRRVDAGQLLEAAEDLERLVQGTASARVVRDWVDDVRSTCRALQAIDVLESYCYLNV